jgi:hypothetical protein
MKKKSIITTAAILVVSSGSYFGIIYNGSIRTVEFLAVLAIGVITGVLLTQIIVVTKAARNK